MVLYPNISQPRTHFQHYINLRNLYTKPGETPRKSFWAPAPLLLLLRQPESSYFSSLGEVRGPLKVLVGSCKGYYKGVLMASGWFRGWGLGLRT